MSRRTLPILAALALGTLLLALFQPAAFFHAWLLAVMAWLNPALGCLLLLFIHRLTGGKWGFTLEPFLLAGAGTLPWALLFSLPLFCGLPQIFPWAAGHSGGVSHPIYQSLAGYLLRALAYVLSYGGLLLLARRPVQPWTGPVGMIVYVLTTFLLAVDWFVSLEPGWHSTAFPLVLMASQAVSALAFGITAAIWAGSEGEVESPAARHTWVDLGNLMLACLMFWAYVSYGEFLIVWSSNLPAQAAWYVHRNAGGWHSVLIALVLLNLLLPVLLLLPKRSKRRFGGFALLTAGLVGFQTLYLAWIILPSFRNSGIGSYLLSLLLVAALGGVFLTLCSRQLRKELPAHV